MTKKVTTIAPARERKERIIYSDALLADILDRVSLGEPLSKICSSDSMPTRKAFFDWVAKDDSIRKKYDLAIQMRADLYAEDILAISDELVIEARYQGEDVKIDVSASAVARNRLRVDARKWLASKMNAKKYGDKVTNEVTGADGGAVLHIHRVELVPMDDSGTD